MAGQGTLQYQFRIDIAAAEAALRRINWTVNGIGTGSASGGKAFQGFEQSATRAATSLSNIESRLRSITTLALGAAGAMGAGSLLKTASDLSASYSSAGFAVRSVSKDVGALAANQERLYRLAQQTRQPLSELAKLYADIEIQTAGRGRSDGFQITGNLARLGAVDLANASPAERGGVQGAQAQLAQLLRSERPEAEELGSIADALPTTFEAMMRGLRAQGFNVNNRRDIQNGAKTGEIKTQQILNALSNQGQFAETLFKGLPQKAEDSLTAVSNSFSKFFGKLDQEAGISASLSTFIQTIVARMDSAMDDGSFTSGAKTFGKRFQDGLLEIDAVGQRVFASLRPLWDEQSRLADTTGETLGSRLNAIGQAAEKAFTTATEVATKFGSVMDGLSGKTTGDLLEAGAIGMFLFGRGGSSGILGKLGGIQGAIGAVIGVAAHREMESQAEQRAKDVAAGRAPSATGMASQGFFNFVEAPYQTTRDALGLNGPVGYNAPLDGQLPFTPAEQAATGSRSRSMDIFRRDTGDRAATPGEMREQRARTALAAGGSTPNLDAAAATQAQAAQTQLQAAQQQATPSATQAGRMSDEQILDTLKKLNGAGARANPGDLSSLLGAPTAPVNMSPAQAQALVESLGVNGPATGSRATTNLASAFAQQNATAATRAAQNAGTAPDPSLGIRRTTISDDNDNVELALQQRKQQSDFEQRSRVLDDALRAYAERYQADRASTPGLDAIDQAERDAKGDAAATAAKLGQGSTGQQSKARDYAMREAEQDRLYQGAQEFAGRERSAVESSRDLTREYANQRAEIATLNDAYGEGDEAIRRTTEMLNAERQIREIVRYLPKQQADALREQARAQAELNLSQEKMKESYDQNKQYFSNIGDALTGTAEKVLTGKGKIIDTLKEMMLEISRISLQQFVFSPFKQLLSDNSGGIANLLGMGQSGTGGSSLGKELGGGEGGWLSGIGSAIGGWFGGGKAIGGDIRGDGAYRVGETGPEIFVPGQAGSIIPAPVVRGMERGGMGMGGNRTQVVNVTIQTPNPQAFAESKGQVSARIRDAVGAGGRFR